MTIEIWLPWQTIRLVSFGSEQICYVRSCLPEREWGSVWVSKSNDQWIHNWMMFVSGPYLYASMEDAKRHVDEYLESKDCIMLDDWDKVDRYRLLL